MESLRYGWWESLLTDHQSDWHRIEIEKRQQAEKKKSISEPSEEQKRLDSPTTSHTQDNKNKIDGQELTVVNPPRDEPESKGGGFSSNFNFEVGWGKWRTSFLRWDVKVGRPTRQAKEAAASSTSSAKNEKKKDTQPDERG